MLPVLSCSLLLEVSGAPLPDVRLPGWTCGARQSAHQVLSCPVGTSAGVYTHTSLEGFPALLGRLGRATFSPLGPVHPGSVWWFLAVVSRSIPNDVNVSTCAVSNLLCIFFDEGLFQCCIHFKLDHCIFIEL